MGLAAFVLTPAQTLLALAVYVLMGCIGLPVFVGGTAGVGRLFGPTGGYIWSWLIAYPLVSAMKGARPDFRRYVLVNIFVGTTVTYLGGVLQMMAVMDLSFGKVMVMAVLPYIPGDIMKDIVAAFLGVKVNQVLQARR